MEQKVQRDLLLEDDVLLVVMASKNGKALFGHSYPG